MKKIICIVLAIVVMFALCGCGNSSIGFGNYNFKVIHICDNSGTCRDYEICKWYQNSEGTPGVEVLLTDGNSLFCSEGTYILASDHCPICK